jgi:uncharacterized membrane protein
LSDLGPFAVIFFEVIRWWAAVQVVALAALPISSRLLARLPSRGYVVAKALGLLLVGYLLWMSATLGVLSNSPVAVAVIVVAVGSFAWLRLPEERRRLADLWRERRGLVVATESLFFLCLLVWAVVRAYQPDIAGTEKPMEFAFLNALLRADRFPPADPWLSGDRKSVV